MSSCGTHYIPILRLQNWIITIAAISKSATNHTATSGTLAGAVRLKVLAVAGVNTVLDVVSSGFLRQPGLYLNNIQNISDINDFISSLVAFLEPIRLIHYYQ